MAIHPYKINSSLVYGLAPFAIDASVVYIHTCEGSMLRNPELYAPVSGDHIYAGDPPEWLPKIVVEGVPWFAEELRVLNHLIKVISQVSPDGEADEVYRVLTSDTLRIVPFAYPVVMKTPAGRPVPGLGRWEAESRRLFLLRHTIINRPMTLLVSAFHEGVHAVEGLTEDDGIVCEVGPHARQLDLTRRLINWLSKQEIPAALNTARGQMIDDLQQSIPALEQRLAMFRQMMK